MKKRKMIISAAMIVLSLLQFSGCRGIYGYREPEQQYFVSAMGFDRAGDLIEVSLEVIIFSVGEAESKIETRLFSGRGETVREAVSSLSGEVSKKLLFSHCALIVLGETLSPGQCDAVFSFCTPENGINISAAVISTPNANSLLKAPSVSTPVTGYDITGVIKQKSRDWGIGLMNRIYQIGDERMRGGSCYSVPFFVLARGDNGEDIYSFFGTRIYSGDMPTIILDLSDSALYSLICGTYGSGTFFVRTDGGEVLQPTVLSAKTGVRGNVEEGVLNIKIITNLQLDERRNIGVDPARVARALEDNTLKFIEKTHTGCGRDPFDLRTRVRTDAQGGTDENTEIGSITVEFSVDIP